MKDVASSGGLACEEFKDFAFAEKGGERELLVPNPEPLLQHCFSCFDTLIIEKDMPCAVFLRTELDAFSSCPVELVAFTIGDELEASCAAIGFRVLYG